MSARRSGHHVTIFDLPGGSSFLDSLVSWDIDAGISTDDGRSINDNYTDLIATKRSTKFSCELLQRGSTGVDAQALQSALETTILSIDSVTAYLSDFRNFTVGITNTWEDGSGGATLDTFPNYISGNIEMNTQLLIAEGTLFPALVETALEGVPSAMYLPYSLAFGGGNVIAGTALMEAKMSGSRDSLTTYDIKLTGKRIPSTPYAGHSVLATAFGGTGLVGVVFRPFGPSTSKGITGTAAIVSANISVNDSQINKMNLELEFRGATVVAA